MARIFLLRVGTELDFDTVNLQVRELGFASDSEKLYLGTSAGNINIPTEDIVKDIVDAKLVSFDSAYTIWKNNGHTGTEEDFLDSLAGDSGESAYETWISLGNTGTEQQFIDSLGGGSGSGKTALTIQAINTPMGGLTGYYYPILSGLAYSGEAVIEFTMNEFRYFSVQEGVNAIDTVYAPKTLSGLIYIPGGYVAGNKNTTIARINLNRDNYDDQMYYVILMADGTISIVVSASNGGSDLHKAIFTISEPMITTLGYSEIEQYWHAT